MASESTPLIQTVRVGPPQRRYPHNTCRRFCTIACCAVLITGFVTFAIHAFILWPHHHHNGLHSHFSGSFKSGRKGLSHDEVESIFLETPSPENAEKWLRYYTAGPHLAGKNLSQV